MGQIQQEIKYTYNDVAIQPAVVSHIRHRIECNIYKDDFLPIFASPMTSVVSKENFKEFESHNIIPMLPRNYTLDERIEYSLNNRWASYSLREFIETWNNEDKFNGEDPIKALLDNANGHMAEVYDAVKKSKEIYGDRIIVMVGNIANPQTYEVAAKSGADYVRTSIGTGQFCSTSTLTGIHYPIASLISDMCAVKEELKKSHRFSKLPKIVADGGIRNFRDVVKALAIGADYVMIGGEFVKCLESAAPCKMMGVEEDVDALALKLDEKFSYEGKGKFMYDGQPTRLFKVGYGMASAMGQQAIGSAPKVEEGLVKMFPLATTLDEWTETMEHALRSAMSYLDCTDINKISDCAVVNVISLHAYDVINN